jgi:hypothetical protein
MPCFEVLDSILNEKIIIELVNMGVVKRYWKAGQLIVFEADRPPLYSEVIEATKRAVPWYRAEEVAMYFMSYMPYPCPNTT